MSKTLFNRNTFNEKNVSNSNDVQDIKIAALKATKATIATATITNLTNAELQAATAGVSNNASAITTNATAISGKQDTITAGNGLRFSTAFGEGATLNVLTGDGIAISGDAVVFDGEDLAVGANITTTGDIQGGNLKYQEDDSGLTIVRNVKDQINSKQAILTQANNAGTNISISDQQVISATSQSVTAGTGLNLSEADELSFTGGDIGDVGITTTGTLALGSITDVEDNIDTLNTNLTGLTYSDEGGIDQTNISNNLRLGTSKNITFPNGGGGISMSNGDIDMASGDINITSGDINMTNGDITMTNGTLFPTNIARDGGSSSPYNDLIMGLTNGSGVDATEDNTYSYVSLQENKVSVGGRFVELLCGRDPPTTGSVGFTMTNAGTTIETALTVNGILSIDGISNVRTAIEAGGGTTFTAGDGLTLSSDVLDFTGGDIGSASITTTGNLTCGTITADDFDGGNMTGITYLNSSGEDITKINNNLQIGSSSTTKTVEVNGVDLNNELTKIQNVSATSSETTFSNDVDINGTLELGSLTDVESTVTSNANKTQQLSHDDSTNTTTIGGKLLISTFEGTSYTRIRIAESGSSGTRLYLVDDDGGNTVGLNTNSLGVTDNFTCESGGNTITTSVSDNTLQMTNRRLKIVNPPTDTVFTNTISQLSSFNSFDYLVEGSVGGYNGVYIGMFRDTTNVDSVLAFGVNGSGANPKIGFAVDNGGDCYVGNDLYVDGNLSLGSISDVETEIGNKQNPITAGTGLAFSGDTLNFEGGDLGSAILRTGGDITLDSTNTLTVGSSATLQVNGDFNLNGDNVIDSQNVTAKSITDIDGDTKDYRTTLQMSAGGRKYGLGIIDDTNDSFAIVVNPQATTPNILLEIDLNGNLKKMGSCTTNGNFIQGGADFQIWNDARGGAGNSSGRAFVHQNTGTASKAESILYVNYASDFGAGTRMDSNVGVNTAPDSSYDLKVNGDTNIGGTLSLGSLSDIESTINTNKDNLTGITYLNSSGEDTTKINNNFQIGTSSTSKTVEVNGVDLNNELTKVTGLSYNSGTNTTSITGNLDLDTIGNVALEFATKEPIISATNKVPIEFCDFTNSITSSLSYDNAPRDTSIVNNIPELSSFTNFDKCIRMTADNYRILDIGILGDGTNNDNVIAFGGHGGGDPDPNISIAMSNNGKLYVADDLYLTGELRGGGRRGGVRGIVLNYTKNSTSTGSYGNDSVLNSVDTTNSGLIGTSFGSVTNGVMTVSESGTYKISVIMTAEIQTYNNRIVAGSYISYNNNDNFRSQNAGLWGIVYVRDNNFGVGATCSYNTVTELTSGDTVSIKTRVGKNSDNRDYNDTATTSEMHMWCQVEIEQLTTNSVIENV